MYKALINDYLADFRSVNGSLRHALDEIEWRTHQDPNIKAQEEILITLRKYFDHYKARGIICVQE